MATRWGIAGAGKISHDFAVALATLPNAEHVIMAVAAQDLSRAQNFAKLHEAKTAYGSYKELAKDKNIDVVYIGTLNPSHLELSKMMLNAGKHVLCEKPLTMNLKQTKELVELAKKKGLFLMEAIWSRCFPAYGTLRNEIDLGSIGEVKQVIVNFGFKLMDVDRLNQKKLGGGTILDLGVYVIQLTSWVFRGEKPESIKACGLLNDEGVDVSMSATLLYPGGRAATILTHSQVDLPNEAIILGTRGTIKLPQFWCPTSIELPGGNVTVPLPQGSLKCNFINSTGLSYEAAHVRSCLLQGLKESPLVTHSESLLIAEIEDELRRQIGVVYAEDK